MKNKVSLAINCIVSFLISTGLIWCMASSFDVNANPVIIGVSSLIFTGLFSVVSIFAKSRSKFLMSIAVIGIVFIFTTLFSLKTILSQANYYVNCIFDFYSRAMDFPKSVDFSEKVSYDADVFFTFVGFILSAINTISLVRIKRIIPVTAEVLICLVPCFVLVNTVASLVPLFTVISILFSLYLTTFLRKYNFGQSGIILSIVIPIVLIIAIVICNIFPIKNYKRYDWQNNLQTKVENLLGISSSSSAKDNGSDDEGEVKNVISDTEDLSNIGPLNQNSEKALKVLTEHSGEIYLKGVAFANYKDNEWTALTKEQAESYPVGFNAFTMTDCESDNKLISITTENKEEVMYTPYFTVEIPDSFKYDVLVTNQYDQLSYDFNYIPYSEVNEYYSFYNTEYNDFVWDVYLELPEDTKEEMLKIAEKSGLTEYAYEDIPNAVKEFVSGHVYYSLETEKMPDGKDFPVWFLSEAESGYCVHYATSAAVMLRALGVPARYVTGYYVNATANEWTTVTSDNAHAWVEYYDYDKGWIPLEATPASFSPADYESEQEATAGTTAISVPTEENTTTAQTATELTETVPTTKPFKDNPNDSNNKSTDFGVLQIVFAVLGLILALILAVAIRCSVINRIRKNHFRTGKSNQRAIYIYRYIENINKFSNNITPDKVIEIAQKAKFSNHTITLEEIKILADFAEKAKNELYNNSSALMKIYLKYFEVI